MRSFNKFLTEHLRNEILYKLLIENGLNLPDDWMDRLNQGPAPMGGMERAKHNPNSPLYRQTARNDILRLWNNGQMSRATKAMVEHSRWIQNRNLHNHSDLAKRLFWQSQVNTADAAVTRHKENLEKVLLNPERRELLASAVHDHRKEADEKFAGTQVRYPYLLHDHPYHGLTRPEIMEKLNETGDGQLTDEFRGTSYDPKEGGSTQAGTIGYVMARVDREREHIMGNQPHRDEITEYPPMPDGTPDWRAPID